MRGLLVASVLGYGLLVLADSSLAGKKGPSVSPASGGPTQVFVIAYRSDGDGDVGPDAGGDEISLRGPKGFDVGRWCPGLYKGKIDTTAIYHQGTAAPAGGYGRFSFRVSAQASGPGSVHRRRTWAVAQPLRLDHF